MVVTELTEVTKNRSRVYLDGEAAFVLYKGELRKYGIMQGAEIDRECYDEIVNEVLLKRAKLRTMKLLQRHSYTETQLTAKLRDSFYPEKTIQEAISYVREYHYIDDVRYAADYLSCYEGSRSFKRMEQELIKKGISRGDFAEAERLWSSRGGACREAELIKALLQKKRFCADMEWKEKQKIRAFLVRKGFSPEDINRAMSSFMQDV